MTNSASCVMIENGSATSPPVYYSGGLGVVSVILTGGNVTIEQLGPDGVTWLAVTAAITTSSRSPNNNLAPGQYRANVAGGATGVWARIDRVPY
jgi:hypothetical protein